VLVFYRMAPFVQRSRPWTRVRDATLAAGMGAVVTLSLLAAVSVPDGPTVSDQHVALSVVEAFGRNVVNVILVDFRALDTLGEVIVVACAGLGVYALVRSGRSTGRA
jgi:multicomponent Na+:H+ antiporter subunit A